MEECSNRGMQKLLQEPRDLSVYVPITEWWQILVFKDEEELARQKILEKFWG